MDYLGKNITANALCYLLIETIFLFFFSIGMRKVQYHTVCIRSDTYNVSQNTVARLFIMNFIDSKCWPEL